jgi:carboxypeptidase C (cathepsin A)
MSEEKKPEEKPKLEESVPVITEHSIVMDDKTLRYTVTAGTLPLKDDKGDIEALIYFTAYTLDQPEGTAKRPLVFAFNGGPGSASVWLHLGALGPYRVKMQDEGWMPPPPYELVPNDQTWLDVADLVFVDPVGTGYSRAADPEDAKKYWNLQGDLESLSEFIRLYLTRFQRWTSPLFLAGESYGSTRVSGLAGRLVDYGIAFNGLMLISTVVNFQTILFERGNDLPYVVILPTYAAAAHYHKKLSKELRARDLSDLLEEVEEWALGEYAAALMRGDTLSKKERKAIVAQLAAYTGLDAEYIEQSNLRVELHHFDKELLRSECLTVGRLDTIPR